MTSPQIKNFLMKLEAMLTRLTKCSLADWSEEYNRLEKQLDKVQQKDFETKEKDPDWYEWLYTMRWRYLNLGNIPPDEILARLNKAIKYIHRLWEKKSYTPEEIVCEQCVGAGKCVQRVNIGCDSYPDYEDRYCTCRKCDGQGKRIKSGFELED